MHKARVNGIELEYEERGSGEPVLLIGTGPIPDSFSPFFSNPELGTGYRLLRYRQRGQNGRTGDPGLVTFAEHAADAAALLEAAGVKRAHVAGHSTGAAIALQLAHDTPGAVHSLALLEPPLLGVPSAGRFFAGAQPALDAFAAGDHDTAMARFLTLATSLDWQTCRTLLDRHVPNGVTDAVKHAGTFFGSYLPALQAWQFGPDDAAAISQPVLSVLGGNSEPFFAESHDMLHAWFSNMEECVVPGIAHLLHMQEPQPVIRGVAEFFARHPMTGRS